MPYFTTSEFRDAMADMDNVSRYTDAMVERARDYIEALVERVCGTSFVARTVTDTVDGSGSKSLVLSKPYVLSVTSVAVDGVEPSGYTYKAPHGLLRRSLNGTSVCWDRGTEVVVEYEAGYSASPPADLKDALMVAVRERVMKLHPLAVAASGRATNVTNETGGSLQFSLAGEDRHTGIPEVDGVINGWRDETAGPSVG